jgi:hypothetical protein
MAIEHPVAQRLPDFLVIDLIVLGMTFAARHYAWERGKWVCGFLFSDINLASIEFGFKFTIPNAPLMI